MWVFLWHILTNLHQLQIATRALCHFLNIAHHWGAVSIKVMQIKVANSNYHARQMPRQLCSH
jgi:hypothetical protein